MHPNTFKLELWVVLGQNTNPDMTSQQSYLTFTNSILNNVRADALSSCQLTTRITHDTTWFDTALQNEVCNYGPECTGQVTPQGGLIAHVSGIISNPPIGEQRFKVAEIGLCAIANGTAQLNWQFSPPASTQRHSRLTAQSQGMVSNPALFTNYSIAFTNVPPGGPPATWTTTNTPTRTVTRTPFITRTRTPTFTPSPLLLLVGHVEWEGRPAQPDTLQQLPLTLTLRSDAFRQTYPNLTTDANGVFTVSVSGPPAGTYTWWAKGPQYLAGGALLPCQEYPSTRGSWA